MGDIDGGLKNSEPQKRMPSAVTASSTPSFTIYTLNKSKTPPDSAYRTQPPIYSAPHYPLKEPSSTTLLTYSA